MESLMAGMTSLNALGFGVGGAPHDLARGTEINTSIQTPTSQFRDLIPGAGEVPTFPLRWK